MPSLNCERYASREMHFSNSFIIHNVVTQPERLILVRWMSLETQWKTTWKPHVFGDDFKPVNKMFLNLHIQRARRTHEEEKTLFDYRVAISASEQAYLLLTLNVTEYQTIKINNDKCHIKQHHCTFCPKHRSTGLKSNFSFFSSKERHISQLFTHSGKFFFGWISFLWRFGNFLERLTSASN